MAKAAKAESPVEYFPEIEQGSADWFELRKGIPTASNFSMIMRDGDANTRTDYMRRLAGELLTGVPAEETYKSKAMLRGNEMEPEARDHYSRKNFVTLERIGFIRRKLPSGRYVGCSPDGLKDKRRRGVEIKSMAPHLMIARLESGAGMPPIHRWQAYGTMWIADLEEVDLMLFYRGMPVSPQFTIKRDEKTIKEVSDAAEVFDWELDKLVKKIRGMGK